MKLSSIRQLKLIYIEMIMQCPCTGLSCSSQHKTLEGRIFVVPFLCNFPKYWVQWFLLLMTNTFKNINRLTPENKAICSIVVDGHGIDIFFHVVCSTFLSALHMDSLELVIIRVCNSVKWNLGSDQVCGVFWISCLVIPWL